MSDLLAGRSITLGVTSGIASYKAVDLMRDLQREGARVRVVLTRSAAELVRPALFEALSGEPVGTELWTDWPEGADEEYARFRRLESGDIIGVEGHGMVTKTGEPTVAVRRFKLLTKTLSTLDDKWHGITDVETRYRRRYSDLWADHAKGLKVQEIFRRRAEIIKTIRKVLDGRDFLEVETPMLHHGVTGAAAKTSSTCCRAPSAACSSASAGRCIPCGSCRTSTV